VNRVAGEHRLCMGGCGCSEALNRFPRIMGLWSIDPDQPELHLLAVALNPSGVTVDDLRDQVRPRTSGRATGQKARPGSQTEPVDVVVMFPVWAVNPQLPVKTKTAPVTNRAHTHPCSRHPPVFHWIISA